MIGSPNMRATRKTLSIETRFSPKPGKAEALLAG